MFTSGYSVTDIFLDDKTCSADTSALQEVFLKHMGNKMQGVPWAVCGPRSKGGKRDEKHLKWLGH